MKKIITAAIMFSVIAYAQAQSITDNYSRLSASFGLMSLENGDESDYGAQIGYLYSVNITNQSLPLFLQFGPELNWMTQSEDDARETIINLAAPINLAYRLELVDGISLEPFAGLNLRCNLIGKLTYDGEDVLDYFEDADANRFQLGMNAGIGLNLNNLYLGYRYNHDLMNYLSGINSKTNYHFFTLGFNF